MKTRIALLIILLLTAFQTARAQSIDIEVDPIAYALQGFSLHAGVNTDHIRYDVGIFGLEIPTGFHGNDGFINKAWGAGAKADYYFSGTEGGWYAGLGMDLTNNRIRLESTGQEKEMLQLGVGANIGYKINLWQGLFVKPWVGLSYVFNSDDITLNGQTFQQASLRPFPTIHLGWQF
jgi:hypothetical protein